MLQACHPRFFATHRYLAYARLVKRRAPARAAVLGGPRTAHCLSLERQVADVRTRRQLALAARDEHERVGLGGADDHVRLLAADRREHDAVVGHLERARIRSSRPGIPS